MIIIAIVVFLYLSALFVILTHAFDFAGRLRRRLTALNIILYEKMALLSKVYEACKADGAEFSSHDEELYNQCLGQSFEKPVFQTAKTAISLQKALQSRISFVLSSRPRVNEREDIVEALAMIADLDKNIRTSSSLYNGDVTAYNYWVSIPGFRWLFFILRQKSKQMIN